MIRVLFIFISLILLSSCDEQNKVNTAYYNIDSLLDAQTDLLLSKNTLLKKIVVLDGKRDTAGITQPDSITLTNEFDLFRKIFRKRNFKIENGSDSRSNLTIRTFTGELSSSEKNVTPESVRLYFYNSPANLRKIEANYHEGNPMFSSSKHLTMEFENIYNKVTLVHYTIEGKQKMILSDSVNFFIQGDLKIN